MKGSALAAENSQLKAEVQLLRKQHQEAARETSEAGTVVAEQMQALEEHKVQPELAVCPWFVLASALT